MLVYGLDKASETLLVFMLFLQPDALLLIFGSSVLGVDNGRFVIHRLYILDDSLLFSSLWIEKSCLYNNNNDQESGKVF